MDIENRIVYDDVKIIDILDSYFEKIKGFRYDPRFRQLFGDCFDEMLAAWEKNISDRKKDPFTIVICGEFKRGKSSLINALLNDDAAVTNVTTETVTVNRITKGEPLNEAVLSGGRRLILSDEEMTRDKLEEVIKASGENISRLEIKRPSDFLDGIAVVDTPGMGDSLRDFSEMTRNAIEQADAVIYVISVNYPISLTEKFFLKTAIIPQKHTELFIVGNFTDVLKNPENYSRMNDLITERMSDLLPGQAVHMISALDERCRQLGEERPACGLNEILKENFDTLRKELGNMIEAKRKLVIPTRMQRLAEAMIIDVNASLEAVEKGIEMTQNEISAAAEKNAAEKSRQQGIYNEQVGRLSNLIEEYKKETYEWMDELLDEMEHEADNISDISASDIIKYYPLYCADTVREALSDCCSHHSVKIYNELDKISAEASKRFSYNSSETDYNFRFVLNNKVWTKGDNVSYIVSQIPDLGLLGIITDGIAGAMRGKEMSEKIGEFIADIKQQYKSLRLSVHKTIDSKYSEMNENVAIRLKEYYSDLIASYDARTTQTALVTQKTESEKNEIKEFTGKLRAILGSLSHELALDVI